MPFTRSQTVRPLLAIVALTSLSGPALAIPSPDLVINLSASVAQLLGLLSVVFGGFAMSGRKKGAKARQGGRRRGGRYVLGGLSLVLLGSLAGNALQYTASIDAKNARLHTNLVRKSVENGEAVGDVSLKTLSFSEQLDHAQGISTETLDRWLGDGRPLNIIDVREDEEFEVGAIAGAAHLRYPDVLSRSSLLPDAGEGNTLLICYSGNRSSELCGELAAQGKACNFMVGGYEKWMSESRPLANDLALDAAELRKLPDFVNKDVLLDTPDVHALVETERAEFVDVRYPDDFAAGHLPGAHNVTMRALPSAVLAERIDALPDTPLIAACYDKRSCFYSTLIGLRLDRAGKDFRGRYSVPHEFYLPSGSGVRDHVAAWQRQQEQLTLASYVVTPLRGALDFLARESGHYALGLIVLVLGVRLLLLPLALKADRDTRVQKSLAGRVAELREELGEHPRALAEATMALYRHHRIRPIVNTLASVFQLGFMLLFYAAVTDSAPFWSESLLWLEQAAAPDPYRVLPLLASALFVLVLAMQIAPGTARGRLLLGAGGIGLFWLLQGLGAAVNLYLLVSMAFLVIQGVALQAIGRRLGWDRRGELAEPPVDDGFVNLADAHRLPLATGKKAERLGMLIEAGHAVPDGFVVTGAITGRASMRPDAPMFDAAETRRLDALWKSLGGGPVAVRSSGTREDGEEASFAGVYESILNVSRDEFEEAVREVHASLDSNRAAEYASRSGETVEGDAGTSLGGIVVQKMVAAEYAGVMFTEHPATSGAIMVELVSGLAEALVSGTVTPDTFSFGKITGERLIDGDDEPEPPIDLAPLLEFGRQLEREFGQPQDIEWAWAKGRFSLLQARDITRSITRGRSPRNLAERERARLIAQLLGRRSVGRREPDIDPEAPVFEQNELSELLPRPTPVSADLMGRLWAAGGSTDLACQDLGIPYDVHVRSVPYITRVFGWTYVNRHEERRRLGKGPSALATFRLARDAEATERAFREDFLPRLQDDMIERNAIALDRLALPTALALLESWTERFVAETYVEAERINIAADFHLKTALGKLAAAKLDPAAWLGDVGETTVSRAMAHISGERVTADDVEAFLLTFGHRAPLDYELSSPRFDEDMALVRQYVERSIGTARDEQGAEQDDLPADKVLRISVRRARDFMCLKEEAKHFCLIELAQIRRLLLAIDDRAGLEGRVFQLSLDEIGQLDDTSALAALVTLADERLADTRLAAPLLPPPALSIGDLERLDLLTGQRPGASGGGELAGKRVAGEHTVTGRVRVIVDAAGIDAFEADEILVARMTDPTWYPLFAKARGIVTEIGGWLSHAAIVAREYDLPAIVGVNGACRNLSTGDVVTLHADGSVERVEERRDDTSGMRGKPVFEQASASRDETTGARSETVDEVMNMTMDERMDNGMETVMNETVMNETENEAANATGDTATDAPPERPEGERVTGRLDVGAVVLSGNFRVTSRVERRAMKNRLGDRRSTVRVSASGDVQPDRRAANRAMNAMQAFRRTS